MHERAEPSQALDGADTAEQAEPPSLETVRLERRGGAAFVVFNRPAKLNAMNRQLHEDFFAALTWAAEDEASAVVVITGAGRAFCSGGDVGGMAASPAGTNVESKPWQVHHHGRHVIDRMLWTEKPVVAMVNGPAVGLGATIALLCDVVIMAEEATIGDRHVNVGLVAGDGGAAIWPLLIGINRAKELLMTGRLVSGVEAGRIGLANTVVPHADLEATTMRLVSELAALPRYAVRGTKVAVNRLLRDQVERVVDLSLALEGLSMLTDEHKEASKAFLARTRRTSDAGNKEEVV